MIQTFTAGALNPILAQPSAEGGLIVRSSNSGEGDSIVFVGNDEGTSLPGSESLGMDYWGDSRIELQTAIQFNSLDSVTYLSAALGIISIYDPGVGGVKGEGSIIVLSLPANNDQLKVGLLGNEYLYTFKTTLTGAAYEIKIAATPALQATYIYEALNHGANIGSDYGTGTPANNFVEALNPSGSVTVPIQDKLPCNRTLAWNISQPVGATLAIAPIVGGVDGTLIGTIPVGGSFLYNGFSFDSQWLTVPTLPPLVTPTSDPILIGGDLCSLRFFCNDVVTPITLKYQTSTDQIHWSDGVTAITALDNNSIATPRVTVPGEGPIEWLRLVVTGNTNTSAALIDAVVISPRKIISPLF